jgi:hypothetical protein
MLLRISLFLTLLFPLARFPSSTQDVSPSGPKPGLTELENARVRVFRYAVPPRETISLPTLNRESLVLSVRGGLLQLISGNEATEVLNVEPGNVAWNRGGTAASLKNPDEVPAEALLVELKDSYAFDQIQVPRSSFDPGYVDPRHFHVQFENEHVRIVLVQLRSHERTEEIQLAARLQISLTAAHENDTSANGSFQEKQWGAGSVSWEKEKLASIENLEGDPLETVLLELKHPFCYESPEQIMQMMPPSLDPAMKPYLDGVRDAVRKHWVKGMPRSARDGEKGRVVVEFKLRSDGIVPDEEIFPMAVFASDSLVEAAISAIRKAAPFQPFPPTFQKPEAEFRFAFLYNLPTHSPGCP